MKKLTLAIIMALSAAATTANATSVYIDVQHDYDGAVVGGDANTRTDVFTQMAANFNSVSNVTNPTGDINGGTNNGAGLGDQFTDRGWGIINGFLGPQVTTFNEFVPLATNPQLTFWFDNIQGHYVAGPTPGSILPVYTSGDIHFMFDSSVLNPGTFTQAVYDPNNYSAAADDNFIDGLEILTLSNVSGGPAIADAITLVLNSTVSFARDNWWFTQDNVDFNDLVAGLVQIAFRTDFNDDQSISNIPVGCTTDSNGDGTNDSNCSNVLRNSNHNGSTNITIPEPSIVALLGIGLLGLGLRHQRKA